MSNIRNVPFTEIVEKVQDLSRTATDDKRRIRGIINRKYTKYLGREFDWPFFKHNSTLSLIAQVNSGVVSVNTQDTVCTFSGLNLEAQTNGRKIKFSNNSNVYDFTWTDSLGGTIAPALSLATNMSNSTYSIFESIYSLPPDFDRFPINGGLLYLSGGRTTPLPELDDDDYYEQITYSPTSTPDKCRLLGYDTAGNRQVEIVPPPSDNMVLANEYLIDVKPMTETTAGTVSIVSGLTAVSGMGTRFTNMNTGDYIRIDGFGIADDSTWYRLEVIENDTTATISPAFRGDSTATVSEYTISSFPKMPPRLQEALIPGSLEDIFTDQNDPNYMFYHSQFAQVLSDNKILILNRKTKDSVDLIASDFNYRR